MGRLVFQPSSSLRAGCNDGLEEEYSQATVFQPSSSLRAGCNEGTGVYDLGHVNVSTLIQPSGRMQPGLPVRVRWRRDQVSTLIQPSGRMQLYDDVRNAEIVFVSTLIQPSGRMQPP